MKTEPYPILGILGISSVFIGLFVLVIGFALTTLRGYGEQGIVVIVLSVVLLFLGLLAILFPRMKTSRISKRKRTDSNFS